MALIETQGLTKTFKARKGTVAAVRGVDLSVDEGEIFGFLGPNGAGKTTTMRMLATLLPPTSGRAKICGYDLLRDAGQVRWQIGYVGQKGGAEPTETGRENLILQGRLCCCQGSCCRCPWPRTFCRGLPGPIRLPTR